MIGTMQWWIIVVKSFFRFFICICGLKLKEMVHPKWKLSFCGVQKIFWRMFVQTTLYTVDFYSIGKTRLLKITSAFHRRKKNLIQVWNNIQESKLITEFAYLDKLSHFLKRTCFNQEDKIKFARVFAFYYIRVVFDSCIERSNLMNLR